MSAFLLLIILATCRIIYINEIQQSQQELPLIPGFLISGLLIFSYHIRCPEGWHGNIPSFSGFP